MRWRLRSRPGDKHSLPIFLNRDCRRRGRRRPTFRPRHRAPLGPASISASTAVTLSATVIGRSPGYTIGGVACVTCSTGNFSTSGFLVGGTLGGNYQWGQFVLGIEGDGDWTNLNGTTFSNCAAGCETKSDWLATVRGRAGYAVDRILFYGTGGGAFGMSRLLTPRFPFSSSTQTGWTAGAGVEFAFTPNLTGKVEYLYVDLGSQSCGAANCYSVSGIGPATTVTLTENVVRAGINYKFW